VRGLVVPVTLQLLEGLAALIGAGTPEDDAELRHALVADLEGGIGGRASFFVQRKTAASLSRGRFWYWPGGIGVGRLKRWWKAVRFML